MIKFEHTVCPSPEQMDFIIEGMRNPMDSWGKSDTDFFSDGDCWTVEDWCAGFKLGPNDKDLMERLKNAGTEHRKFMRMMPVMVRITAPLYWWKEFDTYKIGTVRNSCSTMHTLHKKGATPDAFSHEWIDECRDVTVAPNGYSLVHSLGYVYTIYLEGIERLRKLFNSTHEKKYWYAMIQMLPDGFMMTANVCMNYEVIFNQRLQRCHHKQDEWREEFMKWTETLPYQFLLEAN